MEAGLDLAEAHSPARSKYALSSFPQLLDALVAESRMSTPPLRDITGRGP